MPGPNLLLAVSLAAVCCITSLAGTVTNTNDSGPGSLRQELAVAPAGATIDFALTACPCMIQLASGLVIDRNVIIAGPGADQLIIRGSGILNSFPVLQLQSAGQLNVVIDNLTIANGGFHGVLAQSTTGTRTDVTIRDVVIRDNKSILGGAGIRHQSGRLYIENSTVSNNRVEGSLGGGIYLGDSGSLEMADSTISNNYAFAAGGVFIGNFATANISRSTIDGNSSSGLGGGLYASNATTWIEGSTVSGNNPSGGVLNFAHDGGAATLVVSNSTITGNQGGGLLNWSHSPGKKGEPSIATATIRNVIVAANEAGLPDVGNVINLPGMVANLISGGYNLVGNRGSINVFDQPGDQTGMPGSPIDPRLDPLAFNGGPTRTHALRADSPAIDRGKAFGSNTDQRGLLRPVDNLSIPNAPGGDGSDIGAFEVQSLVASRTPFDYDGDRKSDVSVFRPSTGLWYLLRSTAGYTGMQWGEGTDKITPADYDGDGKTDVAVFRASNSTWYIFNSATQTFSTENWGQAGDLAVPADYDGDGKADVSVYRPSDANWYRKLSGGGFSFVNFGTAEDKPVPSDYDGDGRADIGVFRPSSGIWYFLRTTAGFTGIQWGVGTDIQAPGDYDGDGKTDVAVFRPENGTWYLGMSTSGFASVAWGQSGDIPSSGDFDGDGKTDVAVFRPSNGHWYILNSTVGIADYHFGEAGDQPTESAFRH